MAAGSTYTPIATTTLGSAASSYTFSSIPSTYTDLILIASGAMNTGADSSVNIQVGNGSIDTGTNYSATQLDGNGTSAASYRESSASNLNIGIFSTANSNSIYHFLNYANTTTYKTILGRGNSDVYMRQAVGLWRSTNAINQIKVFNSSGRSFITGTTFTLYGIQAA
jgi:hypothetical protein